MHGPESDVKGFAVGETSASGTARAGGSDAGRRSPIVGGVAARRMPTPRRVLAISSLGVFIAFVDATIVNIAFPDIHESFPQTSLSGLSWVLSAYNIVFAAFLVSAGRLADLVGRKRTFLWGLWVFSIASGLCAAAPSVDTLIAARVIQALGAAMLIPASLGLVIAAFSVEHRAHAVALSTAVGALAAGVGPSLGGFLVTAADWRLVFLVNIPVGIAGIVLTRRYLVESRAPGRRRVPDLLGSVLFALSIALLVLGVVQGSDWGWASAKVLGAWAASILLGVIVVRRCRWHRSPIIDLALLRIRAFTVANAMTVVGGAAFFAYTLCNVLFLTTIWGYSILDTGLALTPGPLVAVLVAGPSSRIVERAGPRAMLVPGAFIWGAAVVWLITQVGVTPNFVSEWLPGMVLLGIGAGMCLPNLTGAAVAAAPGDSFATASALNSVARQVGAAIGVATVVTIIGTPSPADAPAAFDNGWTFSAVCFFVVGTGCLFLGRRGTLAGAELPSLAHAAREVMRDEGPAETASGLEPLETSPPRPIATAEAPPRAETTADFLAQVSIFAGLPADLRERVAADARSVNLAAGDWLFREGDSASGLFVVRAGRLEVVSEGADEGVLRVLGRGAAVGELALLTDEARSASVRAARDSDLIAIDRAPFEALLDDAPEVSRALSRSLAEQLRTSRATVEAARPRPSTITLLPAGDGIPIDEIAARVAHALSRFAAVALLDGRDVPAPQPGTSALALLGPVLDRAENAGDLVLLVGQNPGSGDDWNDFCLKQADRVLLVAGGGDPEGAPLDRPELRGCDLVGYDVVHGSGALAGLAARLDPIETHAIDPHDLDGSAARLARRLTGRSVGVVLSGGGARAFSHIGVLEELLAAGVTIDRVAGVSMGAFIGGMVAAGMDPQEIDARCFDEWVRRRPLGDYTLPRHALIRGDRAEAMLQRTFGTVAIEELERSFFCASADLRRSELVVHRWGALVDRVGPSIAMPILGPPQVRDGRVLIDGSLIDNLPVGTMAALGEGPIIAVDVKASIERATPRPTSSSDGERTASRRVAGGGGRPPGLGETIARVLLLASSKTSDAARRHADLVINPRTDGVGLLEFHQLDRAREAGREAARAALAQAPDQLFG